MLNPVTSSWSRQETRHLLNRAGFGGSPAEVDAMHAMGRARAIDHLLNFEKLSNDYPSLSWASQEAMVKTSAQRAVLRKEFFEKLHTLSAEEADLKRREFGNLIQRENRKQGLEAQHWWFQRMVTTAAPLEEKMTLFWHDHFATSIQKVSEPWYMMRQNQLFRDHAVGNFRNLTQAVVRDPAMMSYLDVERSSRKKPNENFARELMELFTLGEGNYTEHDIKEAARALTGYKINRHTGEVIQSEQAWDDGSKIIFGEKGKFNGKDVVNLIFRRQECPRFIVGKLWEYFVYETPEDFVVNALATTLRESGFKIRPVLKQIFSSEEFYSVRAMANQIKSPIQYLVQLLKELEMKEAPLGFPILGQTQLGQVLFLPPNVAGWDWGKAWINTNTLLMRYNLADRLIKPVKTGKGSMDEMAFKKRMKAGRNNANSVRPNFENIVKRAERNDMHALVDHLMERFFVGTIPAKARESFIAYAESMKGVSFTDEELGELCHLMLSTPYYQLC